MKIVVDMNLSPDWMPVLVKAGHDAVHWSTIGDPDARDRVIAVSQILGEACVGISGETMRNELVSYE